MPDALSAAQRDRCRTEPATQARCDAVRVLMRPESPRPSAKERLAKPRASPGRYLCAADATGCAHRRPFGSPRAGSAPSRTRPPCCRCKVAAATTTTKTLLAGSDGGPTVVSRNRNVAEAVVSSGAAQEAKAIAGELRGSAAKGGFLVDAVKVIVGRSSRTLSSAHTSCWARRPITSVCGAEDSAALAPISMASCAQPRMHCRPLTSRTVWWSESRGCGAAHLAPLGEAATVAEAAQAPGATAERGASRAAFYRSDGITSPASRSSELDSLPSERRPSGRHVGHTRVRTDTSRDGV